MRIKVAVPPDVTRQPLLETTDEAVFALRVPETVDPAEVSAESPPDAEVTPGYAEETAPVAPSRSAAIDSDRAAPPARTIDPSRTIEFEHVYRDGATDRPLNSIFEQKYTSPSDPSVTDSFWILRCRDHEQDKNFTTEKPNPSLVKYGAANHLHQHNIPDAIKGTKDITLQLLGIAVQNCTRELMELNNASVKEIMENEKFRQDGQKESKRKRRKKGVTAQVKAGAATLQRRDDAVITDRQGESCVPLPLPFLIYHCQCMAK